MKKNLTLQKKNTGTNICQLLTPIVALAVVYLVKIGLSTNIPDLFSYNLSFPFIYNVPYGYMYDKWGFFLHDSPIYLHFGDCHQFYLFDFDKEASYKTKSFVGNNNWGMLQNRFLPGMKNYYYCWSYGQQDPYNPYFQMPVNGTANEQIYGNLRDMNKMDPDSWNFNNLLADGAITFYEASAENLTMKIQINDGRPPSSHRTNGVTDFYVETEDNSILVMNIYDGQLILLDLATKAYLQTLHPDVYMISGSQAMPLSSSDGLFASQINALVGAAVYPLAISLLLPIFMYGIIHEKEERLREIMKMNGLKMINYWIANYLWCLCLYIIAVSLFFIFGRFILKTDFFTETNPLILFAVFLGWGLCQVSMAVFFQNFFARAKTAIIVGYLLSTWTSIIGVTFSEAAYPTPRELPYNIRLFPPFAFVRIIYQLTFECGNMKCVQNFADLGGEMWSCFAIVYGGALVFLLLGLYLDVVLPQEYGVQKHPLFFLKGFGKQKKNIKERILLEPENEAQPLQIQAKNVSDKTEAYEIEAEFEDSDVKSENQYVQTIQPPFDDCPLLIKNLRKVYKSVGGKPPKVAVKDLSLHIKRGEMFGLLGPNGAGKTSLISMITGLYPPEAGNAWVGGYDILNQIDMVHRQMGVCPQFDLVWPELTVEEHLYFYARLRGVQASEEKAVVEKALKEVYLANFATFKTKQLSGGMKRRLSVAIALVGEPQIIFLDEPTTGLDPENRRQLWEILAEIRTNRAIVLTTHSMEEADVLCTRIGILTNGALRCIGTQKKLKRKYGGGYHLYINCHRDEHLKLGSSKGPQDSWKKLQEYMKKNIPKAQLQSEFNGGFVYLVEEEGLEVSKIFEEIESKKQELGISDWGISQSTLGDVFMKIMDLSKGFDDDLQ